MKIIDTFINGLKIIEPNIFHDDRGLFIKTFTDEFFQKNGLDISIKETYYSISHQNVIRGMHFQIPPHDHVKLVHVTHGSILDVVLDIRKDSPTYGEYFSTELSLSNGKIIIIPKGLAHGFKSLDNNTSVVYMQTTCYSQEHDCGIQYDSFNFDWQCNTPIVSPRDKSFSHFDIFKTPFIDEQKL